MRTRIGTFGCPSVGPFHARQIQRRRRRSRLDARERNISRCWLHVAVGSHTTWRIRHRRSLQLPRTADLLTRPAPCLAAAARPHDTRGTRDRHALLPLKPRNSRNDSRPVINPSYSPIPYRPKSASYRSIRSLRTACRLCSSTRSFIAPTSAAKCAPSCSLSLRQRFRQPPMSAGRQVTHDNPLWYTSPYTP